MKLFSFRKPLEVNTKDGTLVVNDLAYNHSFVRVDYGKRFRLLMYTDIQFPNTKVYYNQNGKFLFLEKRFESLYDDETSLRAEHIHFVQRYLPQDYSLEFRKIYASVGQIRNQLVEKCITLQMGNQTYTFKSRLSGGKWVRSGEIPQEAIHRWHEHFRYCLKR